MLKGINFNSGLNIYRTAMEPAKGHGEKKIISCALDAISCKQETISCAQDGFSCSLDNFLVPSCAPYTYDKWNL